MSTKSTIATIAALMTIIAAPAYAAQSGKHTQNNGAFASTGSGTKFKTTKPGGYDWQLDGRLPLVYPFSSSH